MKILYLASACHVIPYVASLVLAQMARISDIGSLEKSSHEDYLTISSLVKIWSSYRIVICGWG